MNINDKKTSKLKTIILITISVLLFFYKIAIGYGEWDDLPNGKYLADLSHFNTICGYTTYVPNQDGGDGYHIINYGDVNAHRAQLSGSFSVSMSSNMVYCCDNNRTTRRGTFDYTTYYIAQHVDGQDDWIAGTMSDAISAAIDYTDEHFGDWSIYGQIGPIYRRRNAATEAFEHTHRNTGSAQKLFDSYEAITPSGFANGRLYYGKFGIPRISVDNIEAVNEQDNAESRAWSSAITFAQLRYAVCI